MMSLTIHDHDLINEADRANEPADQAQVSAPVATPHAPLGWAGHNLTQEEWAWLLAVADARDEAAFQEGSN